MNKKFDALQYLGMFSLIVGISLSLYQKSIEGTIGWSLALMWFFIAQFALIFSSFMP